MRPKNPDLDRVKKPKPVVSAKQNLPPWSSTYANVDQGATITVVQEGKRHERPGFDKARDVVQHPSHSGLNSRYS
jgi:hypothetical protein